MENWEWRLENYDRKRVGKLRKENCEWRIENAGALFLAFSLINRKFRGASDLRMEKLTMKNQKTVCIYIINYLYASTMFLNQSLINELSIDDI